MRRHVPVLEQEVLTSLPHQTKNILDGTLGHGWHTQSMVSFCNDKKGEEVHIVWVDRDMDMIKKAKVFLWEAWVDNQVNIVQWSYAEFSKIVQETGKKEFDYMLLDLWVNMDHFKEAERGFSIKLDGDLDMRFDRSSGDSVKEWVAKTHFDELCSLYNKYTDFSQSLIEKVARDMIKTRKKEAFTTTQQVRKWAKSIWINDKRLAVIFQAWRIHINKELEELEFFLQNFYDYLSPWWRCAIMTYHSWEDRIVKQSFKQFVDNWHWILYNKKVIVPTWKEKERNKASRSAKFRIFEKKL